MTERRDSIERAVIGTLGKWNADGVRELTGRMPIFELLDSLGVMVALAEIQGALEIELDPDQYLRLFACRYVGDLVSALDEMVGHS